MTKQEALDRLGPIGSYVLTMDDYPMPVAIDVLSPSGTTRLSFCVHLNTEAWLAIWLKLPRMPGRFVVTWRLMMTSNQIEFEEDNGKRTPHDWPEAKVADLETAILAAWTPPLAVDASEEE